MNIVTQDINDDSIEPIIESKESIKTITMSMSQPTKHKKNAKSNRDDLSTASVSENEKTERKKRIITSSKKWKFTETDLSLDNQAAMIQSLETSDPASFSLFLQQISQKIYNYKMQDIEKGVFSPDRFVHTEFVIDKLKKTPVCFYCQGAVFFFYEYVREPKQWTLERIDNSRGHNCDNVEIACLTCNLRRRTMHYERFLFTKQVKFTKVV